MYKVTHILSREKASARGFVVRRGLWWDRPSKGKCHSPMPLWMVAYGYTEVCSPEERDAMVLAGGDHALWIWVNGRLIL